MPYEQVAAASAVLMADGGADGYATLTSNVGFFPGMKGYLIDNTTLCQAVLLTDLSGSTKIGLRFIVEDNQGVQDPKARAGTVRQYQSSGRTPLGAFTAANGSRVSFVAQVVPVQQPVFNPAVGPV